MEQRTVTIPVPTRGEIYIRYGEPGGVRVETRRLEGEPLAREALPPVDPRGLTPAEMSAVIREAVLEELRREALLAPPAAAPAAPLAPAAPALDEQRLDLLERRLTQRIDDLVTRRLLEQERRIARLEAVPPRTTVVVPREFEPPPVVPPVAPPPIGEPLPPRRFEPRHILPYSGVGVNDPTQFVFGTRLDLGPVTDDVPLTLLPEVSLGFGQGITSFLFAGNLRYDFRPPERSVVVPFASAGLGLWNARTTDLVVNFGYGASLFMGEVPSGPMRVFIEHQGIALYNRHRLLIGGQAVF